MVFLNGIVMFPIPIVLRTAAHIFAVWYSFGHLAKMHFSYCMYMSRCWTARECLPGISLAAQHCERGPHGSGAAYADAAADAEKGLAVIRPNSLGLTLPYTIFQYEVLQQPDKARKIDRTALEDAIAELDSVTEEPHKNSTLIMQLLRDSLILWTSGQDVYFAKLAEQTERHDEMAEHMNVGSEGSALSVEERSLLFVAYKHAVGSRRAAWRTISSMQQRETSKSDSDKGESSECMT